MRFSDNMMMTWRVMLCMVVTFCVVGCADLPGSSDGDRSYDDALIARWSTLTVPEQGWLADEYRNEKLRFQRMVHDRPFKHGLSVMLKSAKAKHPTDWASLVLLPGECATLPSRVISTKGIVVQCCWEKKGLDFLQVEAGHQHGQRLLWIPEHPDWQQGLLVPAVKVPVIGNVLLRIKAMESAPVLKQQP